MASDQIRQMVRCRKRCGISWHEESALGVALMMSSGPPDPRSGMRPVPGQFGGIRYAHLGQVHSLAAHLFNFHGVQLVLIWVLRRAGCRT